MQTCRIVATCDSDKKQTIVIHARMDSLGHLHPKAEAFGYVKDWIEDSSNYLRHPFILEPLGGSEAMLSWGGFDDTASVIDVMGRRLVKGEKFRRRQDGESWSYTVNSIFADEG